MRFHNFEDLKKDAIEHGDLTSVTMGELRDMVGAGRIGTRVLTQISRRLAQHKVGHYPRDLPVRQDDRVYIYRQGSKIARLLEAMERRDENAASTVRSLLGQAEDGDEIAELRMRAAKVDEIRHLIASE